MEIDRPDEQREQAVPDESAQGLPGEETLPQAEAPPVSEADRVAELESRLHSLEEEKKELWERFLRLSADFDNFRKRTQREKLEIIAHANEELIRKLLPVLDNLERALTSAKASADQQAIRHGVELILRQLQEVLAVEGLTPIAALGEPFDPHLHESVGVVEREGEENIVVEELQKGYRFRERVLRPSMVKISVRPVQAEKMEGSKDE